jgi:predicted glutamine amidotransferase
VPEPPVATTNKVSVVVAKAGAAETPRAAVASATAISSAESLDRRIPIRAARFELAAASLLAIPAPLIVKRAESLRPRVCVVEREDRRHHPSVYSDQGSGSSLRGGIWRYGWRVCRLFGMAAGSEPMRATFWLLDAPDSLVDQSHRNVDGVGVGYFDSERAAHVDKQPIAAFEDRRFASAAREIRSRTFVSHVRHATAGGLRAANTHPFCQDDRLFAHNGEIGDISALEAHLADARRLVLGQTDSGATPSQELHQTSSHGTHVHSTSAQDRPVVIVASEQIDDDAWREIPSGELVHVDASLNVTTERLLNGPPPHTL